MSFRICYRCIIQCHVLNFTLYSILFFQTAYKSMAPGTVTVIDIENHYENEASLTYYPARVVIIILILFGYETLLSKYVIFVKHDCFRKTMS